MKKLEVGDTFYFNLSRYKNIRCHICDGDRYVTIKAERFECPSCEGAGTEITVISRTTEKGVVKHVLRDWMDRYQYQIVLDGKNITVQDRYIFDTEDEAKSSHSTMFIVEGLYE